MAAVYEELLSDFVVHASQTVFLAGIFTVWKQTNDCQIIDEVLNKVYIVFYLLDFLYFHNP